MAGAYNPITGIYEQDPTFKAGADGTLTPAGSGYSDMGNIDLRQYGMGGEWAGGQNLKSGGSANSFGTNNKGLMYFGVDSEDTAKALQKKYGGTISTGARSNIAGSFDPDGPGGYRAAQTGSGQGYYYTPPGTKPEDQMKVGHEMGVFSDPSFMDKYGWLVAAIASGVGLAAVPAIAGAAGAVGELGASAALPEVAGTVGTAGGAVTPLTSLVLGSEVPAAALVGGTMGGSVTPLTSLTQGVVGGTLGGAVTPLTSQTLGTAAGAAGGAVTPLTTQALGTTAATTGLGTLATTAGKALLPSVIKALTGGTTTPGTGSPTGTPSGSSNPFGSYGASSNMVGGQAANETPGMQAQSAVPQGQTQQLAQALMLGGQAQPQFGSVGYTPVSQGIQQNAQMMALAKALQGDNDNG